MGRKPRKQYAPQWKVAILRRHLLAKVPVSDVYGEYDLQAIVFYNWQWHTAFVARGP